LIAIGGSSSGRHSFWTSDSTVWQSCRPSVSLALALALDTRLDQMESRRAPAFAGATKRCKPKLKF